MRVPLQWSLCALIFCALTLEVASLARVDHRANYRRPNATQPSYNTQWQQPAWNATAGGHNSWSAYNQTQRQGWATTTQRSIVPGGWALNNNQTNYNPYQPRPENTYYQPNQPRYNNTAGWGSPGFKPNNWTQPQNPQYNPNWQSRNNTGYNPYAPSYNSSSGWGQNNWHQNQHPQQNPQYNPNWQSRNNTGYNPYAPSYNSSSGWGQNNWHQNQHPQQNPQYNGNWQSRSNISQFNPTTQTPPRYNNSVGWGSSGFGQNNWKNPQQYPQQPNWQTNNTYNSGPMNASAPNNQPNSFGWQNNPGNQPGGFGVPSWNNSQSQVPGSQYTPGAPPSLAPFGGQPAPGTGWSNTGSSDSVPLAPIGGSGGGNSAWGNAGQASLSYPGGPVQPGAAGQRPPNSNTNPYANLFN